MTKEEAISTAKAIYLQSAALVGKEVGPNSPEVLADVVRQNFDRVQEPERQKAVGHFLRFLAAVIESPIAADNKYHESNVWAGREKTCPVFPFD